MATLRIVRSTEDLELHHAFHEGLARSYAAFGAGHAVSQVPPSDGVFLLTAQDRTGRLRGGFRIHLCRPSDPPPMAHALGEHREVCAAIRDKGGPKLAEPRALWVEPEERGTGLGAQLTRGIIALAPLLEADRLVILSHQHLDRYHSEVGFLVDLGLGEHAYPDPRFCSKIFWCDPISLVGATSAARAEVLALRAEFSKRLGATTADSAYPLSLTLKNAVESRLN